MESPIRAPRAAGAALLAGLLALGCRDEPAAPTLARETRALVAQRPGVVAVDPALERTGRITVEPARAGLAADTVAAPCEVLPGPDGVADVATTVLARVVAWHVAPGDRVRAGGRVVTLDALEVAAQRTHLARARIDAADLEARAREETAMLPSGVTTRRAAREAGAELARAREAAAAARRALAVAQAPPAGAGGAFTLYAPLSGVVVRRDGTRGAVVPAGATLATLVDDAALRVVAHVPEEAADVPPEAPAVVALRGRAGTLAGRVVWRAPALDRATRTRAVHVALAAPEGAGREVPLGATGTARITRAGAARGVLVPAAAVHREGARATVFVRVAPGRYAARAVVAGRDDGATVEVVAGLREGEPVVVGGTFLVASEDARRRRDAE